LQLAIFEGISAVSSADDVRERLQSRSIDQYADLNEYCSNNKTNSDVLFSIQNNQTSLEKFSNVTDAVQNYLETTEVESLKNELNVVLEKSIKLDNYLQLYDENDWIPKMFTLLIANIVLFLIGSVVSSWLNFQIPALSAMMIYVLIPAFALLVTFAWITAIFFSAMSIMNAGKYRFILLTIISMLKTFKIFFSLLQDFCVGPTGSGGPEMTVQNALLEYGMGEDDLMYQSFLFYKNDCNGTEPWEPIVAQFQQLQDEMSAAEGLIEEFDEIGVENLTAACGTDFLPVITEVNNIQNDFQ
jgi:ABC-type multidrug transport system fused ATPase/permease subunit